MKLSNTKCLITGGAGFIGSNLARKLLSEGSDVVILDNLSSGNLQNIPSEAKFLRGDIAERDTWSALPPVDYVFHLAAMVSVAESVLNPIKCELVNVHSIIHLLEYVKNQNVKKIIFASSAAVYGDGSSLQSESQYPNPKSPYGLSKLSGEYLLKMAWMNNKIPYTALRMFNVFGPYQSTDSAYASVIPIFMMKALKKEKLVIYGDGKQTRDFIFIDQIVDYYVQAMENEAVGVFNAGNQSNCDILTLAKTIQTLCGCSKLGITHREPRAGDIRQSLADITSLRNYFTLTKTDFQSSLETTLEYYRGIAQ